MTTGPGTWKRSLALALALVSIWVLWLGLARAHQIFLLGFLAILVASVFWFPVGWLSRLLPRAAAALLVVLVTVSAIGGLVAVAAPIVVEQAKELGSSIPDATDKAERWLRRAQRDRTVKQLTSGKDVAGMVKNKVPDVVERVATFTVPMLGQVVAFISTAILLLVLAGFLVYDPSLYQQGIRALLPRHWEPEFDALWTPWGQDGLQPTAGRTSPPTFALAAPPPGPSSRQRGLAWVPGIRLTRCLTPFEKFRRARIVLALHKAEACQLE